MVETNDAKDQAKTQYESICRMLGALDVGYDRLAEMKDEFESGMEGDERAEWIKENCVEFRELQEAADDCTSQDEAQERLYESPLSVQVRSAWLDPNDEPFFPAEFEILLCWGGPAVRIRGELDEYKQPDRARMDYQDWGTQWTPYHGADQATLLAYASNFFYGE